MKKMTFALVMTKEKPVGIWVHDGKSFDHFYVVGREDLFEFFTVALMNINVDKVAKEKDFWEYWTSQFPYDVTIEGPFEMSVEFDTASDFGAYSINGLEELVETVKNKNMQPIYEA